MQADAGILVVDRLGWETPSLIPTMGGSALDAFSRYRGFDGLVWPGIEESMDEFSFPSVDGLARLEDWQLVKEHMKRVPAKKLDMVVVAQERFVPELLRDGWSLLGWDVGYYAAEYSHFSIVLNEIVFGLAPEMVEFSKLLNDSLLLSHAGAYGAIADARAVALSRGARLETCTKIECLGILVPGS